MIKECINTYKRKLITKRLYIRTRYASGYVKQTNRNCYEFSVSRLISVPLYVKNRIPLSLDIGVVNFEYITTSYLWRIDFVIGKDILIPFRNVQVSEKWQTMSIDISAYSEAIRHSISRPATISVGLNIIPVHTSDAGTFKIKNIRLRPFNEEEKSKNLIRKAYKERIKISSIDLNEYLRSDFPCKMTGIRVSDAEIMIEGATCKADCDFYLVEIPIFSEFSAKEFFEVAKIQPDASNHFLVKTVRKIDENEYLYDRIYSRWAIAVKTEDGYVLSSFARYADTINSICSIPDIIPENKKGLGGFKFNNFESDLDELGVSHITINIRLTNFLRATVSGNSIPFHYNGKTYYADENKIKKYDHALLAAAKRNIIVYAIILIYPENKSRDKIVGRMLEHPEYNEEGAYTMPNLTNVESVNLYAAAIDFIANRYSRPDKQFGHIHRWIVHNEVDTAWIWCNAGKKTAIELMDIYVKSMRLIYYTTFYYNKNTEVFVSLTHNWQSSFDKNCYTGAEMLELLIAYSRTEGDFRWGIAHHPYPEQLIEPKSWLDPNATNDLNTQLITFKNVELLDKFVRQPYTFYKGKEQRRIVLSEQNPNSFDYSPQALAEQADSLQYVFRKVKKCDGIEAYIAHSWIDARFEGGLKTGLRKYLDDPDDPGGKKPAWYVFKSE